MTWWSWMVIGGLLLGAELLAIDAQFYLVFIGVSAILVGVAELLGISMPHWVQWVAFASLSLITMFTFRKSLYMRLRGNSEGFRATLSGESIVIETDLAPGNDTRVQFRGSKWTARNVGDSNIAGGSKAIVVKVDGLTLHVRADQ